MSTNIEDVKEGVDKMPDTVRTVVKEVVTTVFDEKVTHHLKEKASLSAADVQAAVRGEVQPLCKKVETLEKRLEEQQQTPPLQSTPSLVEHGEFQFDGVSSGVPKGFKLTVTLQIDPTNPMKTKEVGATFMLAWRYWNYGNDAAGEKREPVGPYRELTHSDLARLPKKVRRTFTAWRGLFSFVETSLYEWDADWRATHGPWHKQVLMIIKSKLPQSSSSYKGCSLRCKVSYLYKNLLRTRKAQASLE